MSRAFAPFRNRRHAAGLLAERLAHHRGAHPLVLGVPRGAVPMAALIADALDGELDIVQVRKIGAPWNPELAVAAVDEGGELYVAHHAAECGASDAYIRRTALEELERMHRRRQAWSALRTPIDPAGRCVIVVDDGIATGASMIAALRALRRHEPRHLVCAVAVAATDSLLAVEPHADEIVCLIEAEWFNGVGAWYDDFAEVDDAEVAAVLAAHAGRAMDVPREPPARGAGQVTG